MYCSNCGRENEENSKFCENCGSLLIKPTSRDTPVIKNTSEPTSERKQEEEQAQEQIQRNISNSAATKTNKTKNIILLLLLILLVVGGGFFLRIKNKQGLDESPVNKEKVISDKVRESSGKKEKLNVHISQVDNASFPEVTLYAKIEHSKEVEVKKSTKNDFIVKEIGSDGKSYSANIVDIVPIETSSEMNINLVIDQSGSMSENNKIDDAKYAANEFLSEILKSAKNSVEITSFDDYVYNVQPFTSDERELKRAIESIEPDGQTALFDAIYDSLIQTNQKTGSRFVIAFTDGAENASLHTEDEVVELSRLTGIPVYVISIGSSVDYSEIEEFAQRCNGDYYNVEDSNLSEMLLEIYDEIYQTQRNLYKITYKASSKGELRDYRKVVLESSKKSKFKGKAELDYMPKDTLASIDNAKLLSLITKRTSVENVAVAIVDLETDLEYRVGNARKSYVASGFYAPVYIVAGNQNQGKADEMMSKMDNGAGNILIDSFGGLHDVNNALSRKGYTQTVFNRKFGDVAASNSGHENYTSAVDSAKILRDIYRNKGYKKMQWDLTKDGITLPSDATYYAHRGQGIGAAYNLFAIVEADKAIYGIAIMTAHTGSTDAEAKSIAVPMMSEILAEVHKEMVGK